MVLLYKIITTFHIITELETRDWYDKRGCKSITEYEAVLSDVTVFIPKLITYILINVT